MTKDVHINRGDVCSDESVDGSPEDIHSVVSGASRHTATGRMRALTDLTASVVGGDARVCGCLWTASSKTFFLSLVMCSTITSAQVAGAIIASSMALLADCASMAVDAVTYSFNLVAECRHEEDVRKVRRNQLVASGLSFGALIGISAIFLFFGIKTLNARDWEGPHAKDDVNPYIVFAFAVAGILFDLISLSPYVYYGCPCVKSKEPTSHSDTSVATNLCSAFMHTSADMLRSLTTFTESILIWAYGINGNEADAYATVIVLTTIIIGLVKPMYDWVEDLRDYRAEFAEEDDEEKAVKPKGEREALLKD